MSNIERQVRRNSQRSAYTESRKENKRKSAMQQVNAFLRAKLAKEAKDKERAAKKAEMDAAYHDGNRTGKTYAAIGINESDL